MLKKTITYTDYDGNTRTEDFYFNLNKAEIAEMELSTNGGMEKMLTQIVNSQDGKRIMEVFKGIILKAYGVKTADGKRFEKSEEISKAFEQTEAYSELFMELVTDADKAAAFINGIIPVVKTASPAPAISVNK